MRTTDVDKNMKIIGPKEAVSIDRHAIVKRFVRVTRWIDDNTAEFTCTSGHTNAWLVINRNGVRAFCPGGHERKCASDSRALAQSVQEALEAAGDDLRPAPVTAEQEEDRKILEQMGERELHIRREIRPQVLALNKTLQDLEALSPIPVAGVPPKDHWLLFCRHVFFSPSKDARWHKVVWFGHEHETGWDCRRNFRPQQQWLIDNPGAVGPQMCLGYFHAGCHDRKDNRVQSQLLYNAEADKLTLAQQAALWWWLITVANVSVYALVFTGNKGFHGLLHPAPFDDAGVWADEDAVAHRHPKWDDPLCSHTRHLIPLLRAFDLDLQNFRRGGTARCPGWYREPEPGKKGGWQRLVYLKEPTWQHNWRD
jgi:hypothetical protein